MANGEGDTKSGKGNWSGVANFGTQQIGDHSYNGMPNGKSDAAANEGGAYKFPNIGTEGGASVFGVYSNSLQGGPMVGSVGCNVDVEKVLKYVMGEAKAAEIAGNVAAKVEPKAGASGAGAAGIKHGNIEIDPTKLGDLLAAAEQLGIDLNQYKL